MPQKIKIDTSKDIQSMSEEEKDMFIELVDMSADYGMMSDFTDDEVALYHDILKNRRNKQKQERKIV